MDSEGFGSAFDQFEFLFDQIEYLGDE